MRTNGGAVGLGKGHLAEAQGGEDGDGYRAWLLLTACATAKRTSSGTTRLS